MEITLDTYIIADTHFGHENILKYEPVRKIILGDKSDWKMVELWNDVVKENDTVFHLGDFVWKGDDVAKFAPRLNGKKYLLLGNHDKGKQLYLDNGFEGVIDHTTTERAAYHIAELDGIKIMFTHYPIISDGYDDVRWRYLSEIFDREGCDVNIHGHVHSIELNEMFCINASVEAIGFKPVRLEELLNKWRSQ